MPRWPFRLFLLLVLVAAVGAGIESKLARAATTRTWTGAVDLKWSTPGNWSPAGAPINGDSVVMSVAAQAKKTTNDLVDLTLASLTINAPTTILGNRLGISSSINAYTNVELDLPIALKSDVEFTTTSIANIYLRERVTPLGVVAVDTGGHTLTLSGLGDIEVNGDLIGGGKIAANVKDFDYLVPVTYAATVAGGPNTKILLTVIGDGSGYCGSAASTKFVLNGSRLTAACNVSVGSIAGTGTVELFDNAHLTIAGQPGGPAFNGQWEGVPPSQFVRCCGTGSETLRGTTGYSAAFFLESGRLELDGAGFPQANFVITGGTFAGYGTFGQVVANSSTMSFEPVSGHVGPAVFDDLQFSPDEHVRFSIRGSKPNVDFVQVQIATQVVLDSAMLELDFGDYSPAVGQAFTLFKGAPQLLDTFKGLPEGATFSAGTATFKITYTGGAGHDVVITTLSSSASATPSSTTTPASGPRPYRRYLPVIAAGL